MRFLQQKESFFIFFFCDATLFDFRRSFFCSTMQAQNVWDPGRGEERGDERGDERGGGDRGDEHRDERDDERDDERGDERGDEHGDMRRDERGKYRDANDCKMQANALQEWQKRNRFVCLINPGIHKRSLTPKLLQRWNAKVSDFAPRTLKKNKSERIEHDESSDEMSVEGFQAYMLKLGKKMLKKFEEARQKNPNINAQISQFINSPLNNIGTPPPPPPPPLVPVTPVKNWEHAAETVEMSRLRPSNLTQDLEAGEHENNNVMCYEDGFTNHLGDLDFSLEDFLG
jgi:hypothetical protein